MWKTKHVKGGQWETLEYFWSSPTVTGYFREPEGVKIRVRYGPDYVGINGQEQTLDGRSTKRLEVGGLVSKFFMRMQVRSNRDLDLTYGLAPGQAGEDRPEVPWPVPRPFPR